MIEQQCSSNNEEYQIARNSAAKKSIKPWLDGSLASEFGRVIAVTAEPAATPSPDL